MVEDIALCTGELNSRVATAGVRVRLQKESRSAMGSKVVIIMEV